MISRSTKNSNNVMSMCWTNVTVQEVNACRLQCKHLNKNNAARSKKHVQYKRYSKTYVFATNLTVSPCQTKNVYIDIYIDILG